MWSKDINCIHKLEKKENKMRELFTKYRNLIPRGIGGLFLIQMISIFAFSILYSTLVLYITHSLQLNDSLSTSIVAAFFAINYVLHLLGGYIGGRWMSNRCLLFIGLCFQMIGCLLISFPGMNTLFWGLSSFVMGTGLSTTCISCMITQIYEPNDKRRETAFILNYSGFNIKVAVLLLSCKRLLQSSVDSGS